MKKALLLLAVLSVSVSLYGCPNYVPTIRGYSESGIKTAQDAVDLHVDLLKADLCATPFSAVVRHPEIAGALRDLCIGGRGTTVEEMLNEVEK